MEEEISAQELSQNLIPAVEEQMESPATPFVKEHYTRLCEEGVEEVEVKMMIALCLADEIEAFQKEGRTFNLQRYQNMLQFLPALPE